MGALSYFFDHHISCMLVCLNEPVGVACALSPVETFQAKVGARRPKPPSSAVKARGRLQPCWRRGRRHTCADEKSSTRQAVAMPIGLATKVLCKMSPIAGTTGFVYRRSIITRRFKMISYDKFFCFEFVSYTSKRKQVK